MIPDLLWAGSFLTFVFLAATAGRRFAAALRRAGRPVLTGAERRELVARDPLGSFSLVWRDDLVVSGEFLRHQSDPRAEAWRFCTWALVLLSALAFIFGRDLGRGITAEATLKVGPELVGFAAWAIAIFWCVQLTVAAVDRPRRTEWLVVCLGGVMGSLAIVYGTSLL